MIQGRQCCELQPNQFVNYTNYASNLPCGPTVTRQVQKLFQNLWKRSPYLQGWVQRPFGAKTEQTDRQEYIGREKIIFNKKLNRVEIYWKSKHSEQARSKSPVVLFVLFVMFSFHWSIFKLLTVPPQSTYITKTRLYFACALYLKLLYKHFIDLRSNHSSLNSLTNKTNRNHSL